MGTLILNLTAEDEQAISRIALALGVESHEAVRWAIHETDRRLTHQGTVNDLVDDALHKHKGLLDRLADS